MTFSGRIYLWTQYLDVFRNADFVHKMLGFGAEAWDGRMHHMRTIRLYHTCSSTGLLA